jgi:hypothetical protein
MHAARVLSQWPSDRAVVGHAVRAAALVRVVRALLTGAKLSLTELGRGRANSRFQRTLRMARIWQASATDSSGRPSSVEAMTAVPARRARSRLVVSGITRTELRA